MAQEWDSATAILVITKEDLNPSDITQGLGVSPSITLEPSSDRSFKDGAGVWAIVVDQGANESTSGRFAILENAIEPIRSQLAKLRDNGYSVEVLLTGHVDRIHQIPLDAPTLQSLHRLGLPVSFTTRRSRTDEDVFWEELGL